MLPSTLGAEFTFRENKRTQRENRWSLGPRICCGSVLKAGCEEDSVFCVHSVRLLLELGAIWGFGRAEVLHQFEKRAKKKLQITVTTAAALMMLSITDRTKWTNV